MSWSGGTYTKGNSATGGWTGDASLGIGIEAGRHDTQDNDFASGINNCIAKDGQNAATADLPMGGFKHTNVANASARNNYAAVGQVQDGDFIWLGTTGGTATAQTATATPAITAYKAGQKFRMQIGSGLGSTGSVATAHTININSIGAKNIVNNEDSTNPTLGTWVAGALMELVYDGTNFRITNDPGGWLTYTPTLASTPGSASSTSTSGVFRKFGLQIIVKASGSWTQNTSAAAYATLTLPVNANGTDQFMSGSAAPGASALGAVVYNSAATSMRVYVYDVSTFPVGSTRYVYMQGVYRSV